MPHIPAPAVWEQVEETVTHPPPQVLVIGGVAVDVSCDTVAAPALHTSNPCSITESLGGVANNVAYALHLSGTPTRLVSCIGNDVSGRWIKEQIQARGMDTSGLTVSPTAATARYVAVNDASGNLFVAAADMHAIASMSAATLTAAITASDAPCVILDGNLGAKSTVSILRHCHKTNTKVVFEPTSATKSTLPFTLPNPPCFPTPLLHLAAPNTHELDAMYDAATHAELFDTHLPWWIIIDSLLIESTFRDSLEQLSRSSGTDLISTGILQKAINLSPYIPNLYVKLGANGCLLVRLCAPGDGLLRERTGRGKVVRKAREGEEVGGIYIRYFPAEEVEEGGVVSVNGAGDTFLGVLVAGLGRGEEVEEAVGRAQRAAVLTLGCREAVSAGVKGMV